MLPNQSHRWQWLEHGFLKLSSIYGYREVRTPVFEDINLFVRTAGESSDIVTKEMYDFVDKGGRHIALKPEETAPLARAVIEHNLCPTGTVGRFCYISPIYRYERPQKGRFREAHQVGLELIGSPNVAADVEIIEMTVKFYEMLGLKGLRVLINSLGRDECRARYREAILQHSDEMLKSQSTEFQERVQKNPLRLLDSKVPDIQILMKTAPNVLEYLEDEGKEKFGQIQELLTAAGISYQVEPTLVRGLDYYTDTVFEVQSTKLGAQSALCGGGRYDNLIKELGGPATPSVGVAMGIERALMVAEEEGLLPEEPSPTVFVAYMSDETGREAKKLVGELRNQGISALIDIDGKSLKSQLRQADKSGAKQVIVVGEDELASGQVALRNLATSEQKLIGRSEVANHLGSS